MPKLAGLSNNLDRRRNRLPDESKLLFQTYSNGVNLNLYTKITKILSFSHFFWRENLYVPTYLGLDHWATTRGTVVSRPEALTPDPVFICPKGPQPAPLHCPLCLAGPRELSGLCSSAGLNDIIASPLPSDSELAALSAANSPTTTALLSPPALVCDVTGYYPPYPWLIVSPLLLCSRHLRSPVA